MAAWRLLAGAGVIGGYALLSHWLMVHAPGHPWAVAVLFGPLVLGIGVSALARRNGWLLAVALALGAVLAVIVARGGVQDIQRMYLLQHAAIHAVLALSFGATLLPGSTALITALAERVHTDFPPSLRAYTRWLTGAWTAYFVGMIVVSLLIYALLPWTAWSFFCNLLTPAAGLSFFVGEHYVRYLRHPEFERVSLATAVQAYRSHSAHTTS